MNSNWAFEAEAGGSGSQGLSKKKGGKPLNTLTETLKSTHDLKRKKLNQLSQMKRAVPPASGRLNQDGCDSKTCLHYTPHHSQVNLGYAVKPI